MPQAKEDWYERVRRRWNSRFKGKGGFRGRALVVLDGRGLLVEVEGWRMVRLGPPSEEGVDVILSGPSARLRGVKGEGELVWMVINREVKAKGRFRLLSKNLPLWARLLPFLASSVGR